MMYKIGHNHSLYAGTTKADTRQDGIIVLNISSCPNNVTLCINNSLFRVINVFICTYAVNR